MQIKPLEKAFASFALTGMLAGVPAYGFDSEPKADKSVSVMGDIDGKIKPVARVVYAVPNPSGDGILVIGQFSYRDGGEVRQFALSFNSNGYRGLGENDRVYFISGDCTGPGYIKNNSHLVGGYVDVVVDTSNGELYTTNLDASAGDEFTASSIGHDGMGCQPDISFYSELIEAEKRSPLNISGPYFTK